MRHWILLFLTAALVVSNSTPGFGEDLEVPLSTVGIGDPAGMMRVYLLRQVERACQRWKNEFEALKTPTSADTDAEMNQPRWDAERRKLAVPENIAACQRRLRSQVLQAIGGLPERTPLEAQVVGVISQSGYRVEKVIFQSQPKHFVTALLYVPEAPAFKPPYPGVLVACGHAFEGKGGAAHQAMGALLALNGMAALVFDPVEQGERLQHVYPDHLAGRDFTTSRHTLIGMGSLLLGQNIARFEIWDGMRAIDYLQSRPEILGHIHHLAPAFADTLERFMTSQRQVDTFIGRSDGIELNRRGRRFSLRGHGRLEFFVCSEQCFDSLP